MNHDNILNNLARVSVEHLTSKAGNPYNRLAVTTNDGYVLTLFLTNEQAYALEKAVESDNKENAGKSPLD